MSAPVQGKIMFNTNDSTGLTSQDNSNEPIENSNTNDPAKETKKLDDLLKHSTQPLMILKSKFPFQLAPDELILDVNRVSYIKKSLFSKEVYAIEIKDITEVILTNDPFFASMMIESKILIEDKILISHLPKSQARRAQAIMHGMIACVKQGINYQETDMTEMVKKLETIGQPNIDITPVVK